MGRFVIRRLLQAVVLLFFISIGVFLLIHAIPGGPQRVFLAPHQTPQERAQIIHAYGLDQPLYIQYISWLGNVIHGNFGFSFANFQPVTTQIGSRFPNTAELFLTALGFALIVAILLGVLSAVRQYSIFDYTATVLSYVGISMPVFWFALILQEIFGVQFQLLPIFGMTSSNTTGFTVLDNFEDRLVHLILPTVVLSLLFIATWSRYLRSSMLDTVRQDYIRTARAKGLSTRKIFFQHALRNALIPFVTQVAIDFGGIAAGAVVTESVFAWPGMGRLFLDSLDVRDYPVLMAMLLLSAVFVIMFNLLADILYGVIDPRIRYS